MVAAIIVVAEIAASESVTAGQRRHSGLTRTDTKAVKVPKRERRL